ncbi:hypothetical protein BU25DRAFT_481583 [Macroventuria anomochaeta]|uniref:Uncharacterized protein n=1 Tax=Macroventuria anomochaeta TaxID=301207 RepID=A0ACB6SAN3_9PLEO|nr:uncharacterized protein BU25DRAFT_481583 [Macroventuria anomochaeta]KAF2631114.1 hypothetical protein BU25DRAFT_481583 [Macroventuria anomochaeta]
MASPASNDADADATENFLESIIISSATSSEDDFGSVPPSPEIGMAREGGSEVSGLDLEEEDEEDGADAELPGTPAPDDDAASTIVTGNQMAKLLRMRQTQQSPPESAQRASSEPTNPQLMTPAPTCPPTRRSARAKSTLIYDQKYHPMDDVIRPSQAAKRRTLHGEKPALVDDLDAFSLEDSRSDIGSIVGDEDSDDEEPQPPTRGRKRKRSTSRTPEPTRRSSRRRTNPKVSYNMKIHPQDSDLKRVYACDGSKSSPSPTKQVNSSKNSSPSKKGSLEDFEQACRSLLADDSREPSPEPSPELSPRRTLAPEPTIKRPNKFVDAYPDLRPDIAYLAGDHDVWPEVKGLQFHIFTERMEDQLNAEAEAASPFHYEDDDKENDVTNPELVPRPNPLDGISIIPASHYRRSPGLYALPGHSSIASNAFYVNPQFEASPYGLGWSDGAHDFDNSDTHDCPVPDYMRILASSENLPRASPPMEARSHRDDTVVSSSPVRNLEGLELLR